MPTEQVKEQEQLKAQVKDGKDVHGHAPFTHGVLHSVFPPALLSAVRRQENDLFNFYQSKELSGTSDPALRSLLDSLYSPAFLAKIAALADVPKLLPGKMHVSAHRYPKNGYLLCHDDDIMASAGISRRIAFILYLVEEDWSDEKDGGSLLLYQKPDGSENSTWTTPVKITPSFGSFAFFKVGQDSLHCVDEVIGNRERVSISGWLYGPSDPQSCSQTFTKPLAELPLVHSLADPPCLEQMINPIYLSESSIASIQSHFIDNSAIDLYSFLNPETYKSLVQACDEAQWTLSRAGPPTLQWFASPDTQHPTPRIMQSVSQLLTCPAFIQLLERMTSLPLQAHTQDVSCLARRFTEKCYTMLKDPAESAALSVVLDAACPNGPLDGGQAVYVYGEDTLLCTERRGNALRVVLMDPGVHAFTRYVRAGSSGGLVEFRVHGIRGLDLDGDNE